MAPIADDRLPQLARGREARKVTPAAIRVVDVPGTGPQLLGNLRQVDALLAVGALARTRSRSSALELLVADRDHVERRLERVRQQAKSGDPKLRKEVVAARAAARPRRGRRLGRGLRRARCRRSSTR